MQLTNVMFCEHLNKHLFILMHHCVFFPPSPTFHLKHFPEPLTAFWLQMLYSQSLREKALSWAFRPLIHTKGRLEEVTSTLYVPPIGEDC